MQALPAIAFWRSMAAAMDSPFICRSKSIRQVTPPQAAAFVPVSKSSCE
jgi:hypothetical protein